MASKIVSGEVETIRYYNGTGNDIVANQIVPYGAAPNIRGLVAYDAIPNATWGVLVSKGRVKFAADNTVGGGVNASYYRSLTTSLVTTTGTSVTAFVGYGASSILLANLGDDIEVDMERARPRGET